MSTFHRGQADEFLTLEVEKLCFSVGSSTQLPVVSFGNLKLSTHVPGKDESQVLNLMNNLTFTYSIWSAITHNLFNDSSRPLIIDNFLSKGSSVGGEGNSLTGTNKENLAIIFLLRKTIRS